MIFSSSLIVKTSNNGILFFNANEKTSKGPAKSRTSTSLNIKTPTFVFFHHLRAYIIFTYY